MFEKVSRSLKYDSNIFFGPPTYISTLDSYSGPYMRAVRASFQRGIRAWYPLFCACANLKPMNILKLYTARCGAPVHDVLCVNIPIKYITSWQSGMQ